MIDSSFILEFLYNTLHCIFTYVLHSHYINNRHSDSDVLIFKRVLDQRTHMLTLLYISPLCYIDPRYGLCTSMYFCERYRWYF